MSVEPRWSTYALYSGAHIAEHWTERFAAGAQVSLVLGVGFDPRMCLGLELFNQVGPVSSVALHTVRFNAPSDAIARTMADANELRFATLIGQRQTQDLAIAGGTIDEASRNAADAVGSLAMFGEPTDIVVDINALPRSIFFPLVSKLLYLCDQQGVDAPNLHIVAGDAAWLDADIRVKGVHEHASWLHPFEGTFSVESTQNIPRVWIPILGEGTDVQLERISTLVDPDEVCPMLPFPARNPRRGDDLVREYHEILFDRLRADSGAVIYADEANPFQVYRRLRESTERYRETLSPLGRCKTAYSALSSKLVAVGALLVAYELRELEHDIGVADIGAQHHVVARGVSIDEATEGTELIGLTLSGDSYR